MGRHSQDAVRATGGGPAPGAHAGHPVVAGLVAAVVGFASSFAVVLEGLRGAGATADQAASGLLALSVGMGLAGILLAVRLRVPVAVAWSTPGAALLAGAPEGTSFRTAVAAFVVTGLLLVLTGFVAPLGRALAALPPALAGAMLAGVLLPLCTAPVRGVVDLPVLVVPAVLTWLVAYRFLRIWAVPLAFAAGALAVVLTGEGTDGPLRLLPVVEPVLPSFGDPRAVLGLAVPLFVVTMAAQNVPGLGVLAAYGYRPPLRPLLVTTGGATALFAPLGAHAINLAAITAAIMAGPDAGPDRDRRWLAALTSGVAYVGFGLGAGLVTGLVALAPLLLVQAIAGLALLGALGAALATAAADAGRREAAVVALVVAASGVAVGGIGAPFWGLVAGLVVDGLLRAHRHRSPA